MVAKSITSRWLEESCKIKILEKLTESIKMIKIKLGFAKKKSKIPEAWTKPKQKYDTPMDWVLDVQPAPVKKNPISRRPVFSFNIPRRDLTFLRSNFAFKAKRTIMFFLLLACLISIWSFSLVNPLSLLYYLPTTYICLDYLRRTVTKKRKIWLLLKNIEEDK